MRSRGLSSNFSCFRCCYHSQRRRCQCRRNGARKLKTSLHAGILCLPKDSICRQLWHDWNVAILTKQISDFAMIVLREGSCPARIPPPPAPTQIFLTKMRSYLERKHKRVCYITLTQALQADFFSGTLRINARTFMFMFFPTSLQNAQTATTPETHDVKTQILPTWLIPPSIFALSTLPCPLLQNTI